jgi:hypothetical protein
MDGRVVDGGGLENLIRHYPEFTDSGVNVGHIPR